MLVAGEQRQPWVVPRVVVPEDAVIVGIGVMETVLSPQRIATGYVYCENDVQTAAIKKRNLRLKFGDIVLNRVYHRRVRKMAKWGSVQEDVQSAL